MDRPDAHAPLAVHGDHTHKRGMIMIGAHFALSDQNHPRSDGHTHGPGSSDIRMSSITFEGMWGITDHLTVNMLLPYVSSSSRSIYTLQQTVDSRHLGDFQLTSLVKVQNSRHSRTHLNLGMSFPTGSVDLMEYSAIGYTKLPYSMQTGSGSYDAILGFTWWYQKEKWSMGAQPMATIRTGNNHNGYMYGNHYVGNVWAAWRVSEQMSISARFETHIQGSMRGEDPEIGTEFIIPQGVHVGIGFGINYYFLRGMLKGNRIAVEGSTPLFYTDDLESQRINWEFKGGWQKMYHLYGDHDMSDMKMSPSNHQQHQGHH